MMLDRKKMTAHQKVAHSPLLGTIQSPERCRVRRIAEPVDRIAADTPAVSSA